MSGAADTPVLLVVFDRPDLARAAISRLRDIRPRRLFVAADGPRHDHPADEANCDAARRAVELVDWPCDLEITSAGQNLGCAERMRSAIDWVLDQVDRVVVLEDDIAPHPSFHEWAAAMLDRFASDDEVAMVSGSNQLGRWRDDGTLDHLVVRRGSIHGWATWSDSWFGVRRRAAALRPGPERAAKVAALEPLVAESLRVRLAVRDGGRRLMWDTEWETDRLLVGSLAVVPTRNLTANVGYGDRATHTDDVDDIRSAVPVWSAPPVSPAADTPSAPAGTAATGAARVDDEYDRRSLLLDLMASYRRPGVLATAWALRQRSASLGTDDVDREARWHHEAPFRSRTEALATLRHLRDVGVRSERLEQIEFALSSLPTTAGSAPRSGPTS